jgi:spore coat polysaccharide biosynthesis predicted glycosyltransferase SpsG
MENPSASQPGTVSTPREAAKRFPTEPGGVRDAHACVELANALDACWVVLDGGFDRAYQRAVGHAGHRLLVIDDDGSADGYSAALILNQSPAAHEALYARRYPGSELLLGTRYAPVRREFATCTEWQRRRPPTARRLLVMLGEDAPPEVTCAVIHALDRVALPQWEIVVIVDLARSRRVSLEAAARQAQAAVYLKQSGADAPEWMVWADLAVSASAAATWELCCLGVPTVLLVLAENDASTARILAQEGCVENIGHWNPKRSAATLSGTVRALAEDADRRSTLSGNARQRVDGRGAERVVERLLAIADRSAEVVA